MLKDMEKSIENLRDHYGYTKTKKKTHKIQKGEDLILLARG